MKLRIKDLSIKKKVNKIWNDHIDRRDNTNKLWTILMWQEWIRNWQK